MTVQAIRKATVGQVRAPQRSNFNAMVANCVPEWRRRLRPPVQTTRLPLLRLGRKLERHEVRTTLGSFSIIPSNRLSQLLSSQHPAQIRCSEPPSRSDRLSSTAETPSHHGTLYQWPAQSNLREESAEGADIGKSNPPARCQW